MPSARVQNSRSCGAEGKPTQGRGNSANSNTGDAIAPSCSIRSLRGFGERRRVQGFLSLDSATLGLRCEGTDLEMSFQPIVGNVVVGKLLLFVLELAGMPVLEVEIGTR